MANLSSNYYFVLHIFRFYLWNVVQFLKSNTRKFLGKIDAFNLNDGDMKNVGKS